MKQTYDDIESLPKLAAFNEVQFKQNPEKWEIYAWAIRDIMSKVSGLPKDETPQRDKLAYEEILGYRRPPKKDYE